MKIIQLSKDRLGFFDKEASPTFWDDQWRQAINAKTYLRYRKGYLGPFARPFLRYLPKKGKIIEAGCGFGKYVVALRSLGYECEGVDYAEESVRAVNNLLPDIPIAVGDVTHLPVPDGHYQGYISLGVMEHRREGPEPFLSEASRVLSPGGIAYISVPYFNILRQIKARMNFYNGTMGNLVFYQQAYTIREISRIISQFGFRILSIHGYGSYITIRDEIPPFATLDSIPKIGGLYRIMTRRIPYCDRFLGHMVGFVCERQSS